MPGSDICVRLYCKEGEPAAPIDELPAAGITLPAALKKLGVHAFAGTDVVSVRCSASLTSIGSEAFVDCDQLEWIAITAQTTDIASNAFGELTDLIIYAPYGSAAATFADQKGYTFIAWDGD